MNLKIEGVWCKTRTEFDKLSKAYTKQGNKNIFEIIVKEIIKITKYDLFSSLY